MIVPAAVLSLLLAAPARAADAGAGDPDELARQIAKQGEALSTDDCTSACSALASMRRAADRLCALDPGARCREARRVVDDASRKVRAACPQCAIALQPQPEEAPMPAAKTPPAEPQAAPPAAERERGGCASCGGGGGGNAESIAGLFAVLLVLRRMLARRR